MTHEHEYEQGNFWDETVSCECGESRKATTEELAYERELIAASERKQLEDMDAYINDLRDVHDALTSS